MLAFIMGTITLTAQTIDLQHRFGQGEDSIRCRQNIALYYEYYQAKDYKSAYEPWKEVFFKFPIARANMYAEGRTIIKNLLKSEKDEKKKNHQGLAGI